MNRRLVLATFALAALALSAGCLGFFTDSSIDRETLDAEPVAAYEWETDAAVHIEITENAKFAAVYRVNRSSIELFRRDGFGGRNALDVSALRYRYPNGTVINGSQFDEHGGEIDRSRDRVRVTFPTDGPADGSARFAFSASSTPKRFSLPVYVEGSYEVLLPENRRIGVPILGTASPGRFNTTRVDGRTLIRWESVSSQSVAVQYYLQRDLYIFGGILLVGSLVGLVGGLYYRRQIQRLREKREQYGLDVDTDDEFRKGPPPGMG